MAFVKSDNAADKVGIWTSGLCAVHCLLLPVLLPLIPALGSMFFAQVWFERGILTLSLLIGLWALLVGFFKHHRQIYPVYALALGGVIYWNKDAFGHDLEPFTVAIGAALIIAAHIINIRLCRSCKSCQETSCQSQQA